MAATALPTYETEILDQLPGLADMDEAIVTLGRTGARIRQMIANGNFRRVYKLGTDQRALYYFDRTELAEMAG